MSGNGIFEKRQKIIFCYKAWTFILGKEEFFRLLTYCALGVNDDTKFSFIVEQGKIFGHFNESLKMDYFLTDEYPEFEKSLSTFQYLVRKEKIQVLDSIVIILSVCNFLFINYYLSLTVLAILFYSHYR